MKVFAKINCAGALSNIDELLKVSDGIMVSRINLGIDLEVEKVFVA